MKQAKLFLMMLVLLTAARMIAQPPPPPPPANGPKLVVPTWQIVGGSGQQINGAIHRFVGGGSTLTSSVSLSASNANVFDMTLVQAPNGKMYGLQIGDPNASPVKNGQIYEYDYNTNSLTSKFTFNSTTGINPYGRLCLASNGTMYGITSGGGANNAGCIFSYVPGSTTATKLLDMSTSDICYGSSMIQGSNGNLFFYTYSGGANNSGKIYEYSISANSLTFRADKPAGNDRSAMLEYSPGVFYFTTNWSPDGNNGSLYRFTYSTNAVDSIFEWGYLANPTQALVKGSDGLIYGTCPHENDQNSSGNLFSYDPTSNIETDIFSFGSGANPTSGLFVASNGKLYGQTKNGGANGYGTLYEFDITLQTVTSEISLDASTGFWYAGSVTEYINAACTPTVSITSTGTSPCSSITFTASTTNTSGTITYQWHKNTAVVATGATYTATSLNYGDSVYCFISSATTCGTKVQTASSNRIIITSSAASAPSVTISANHTNLDLGGTVVLTATPVNAGANPIYAWYMNGVAVPSQRYVTMTYGGALGNGDQITCTMTSNTCGSSPVTVGSNTVTFTKSGSNAKDIVTFRMPSQIGTSVINTTNATVTGTVPAGSRTSMHPTSMTVSPLAGYAPSYTTNQDFTGSVTYLVRAQNGSARVWTVTFTDPSGHRTRSTTGIANTPDVKSLSVYPDPANSFVMLSTEGGKEAPVVTIIDMMGRVMYHQQLPVTEQINHMVDVSEYATGSYIVYISVGERKQTQNFVVSK